MLIFGNIIKLSADILIIGNFINIYYFPQMSLFCFIQLIIKHFPFFSSLYKFFKLYNNFFQLC